MKEIMIILVVILMTDEGKEIGVERQYWIGSAVLENINKMWRECDQEGQRLLTTNEIRSYTCPIFSRTSS